MEPKLKPSTLAVHGAGLEAFAAPDGCEPGSPPIYPATTYHYPAMARTDAVAGGAEGYMYARYRHPTGDALERALCLLEDAERAFVFASGMAALHAAVFAAGLAPGDVVVCAEDNYGGTLGLLRHVFEPMGVVLRFADLHRAEALDTALAGARVKLVVAETVSNPLLRVVGLAALAEKTHAAGARLLVDATFTPPLMVKPLALGADYCVHSATKYLGGHGDVTGGVVLARAAEAPALDRCRKLVGGMMGAFDAWLVLRGLQTLPLRFERQCANAARVAAWLAGHAAIARVNYPGLPGHPDAANIAAQFPPGMAGAMLSCELRLPGVAPGGVKAAVMATADRLRLVKPGTSFGDVQTMVAYPLISSHRELTAAERARIGLRESLLRFSFGIEDAGDLIADLDQALCHS